jgi:transcription elongation factor Elf1
MTDDMLICLVCDRAFTTARQLLHHQKQKKHFLCSICDSTFANVEQLKEHKERENHWSDMEDGDEDKMEDENGVQSDSSSEGDDMSQTFSEIERLL